MGHEENMGLGLRMWDDKRRRNVTDGAFDSFVLIPYLANVEYSERVAVCDFLNGDGRSKESVDLTASSKFEIASSNLR